MTYGTLISTQTVGAGGALSIDFTSIPQTYTDIVVVVSGRTNSTTTSSSNFGDILIKFNGSATGYNQRQLYYNGSTAASNGGFYTTSGYVGGMNGANTTANSFSSAQIYIPNYTAAINKVFSIENTGEQNATAAFGQIVANIWSNTAAITSISIYPLGGVDTWAQYSTASLYGINRIPTASLGTTPTVDALVVAGGGGGNTAGGGAGGLQVFAATSVTAGSAINVTVGAGGAGAYATGTNATNGSNSVFGALTASVGGGGGAGFSNSGANNGSSGGSGGGAGGADSGSSGTPGAGTAGQGYAGGNAVAQSTNQGRGGGGGAGAAGGNGSGSVSGNGGVGVVNTYNGFSTYYAGGGGGGSNGGTAGGGGTGGGGNGGNQVTGANGLVNTGGGAGGGLATAGAPGGSGGSGVVIIRYPDTYNPPTAVSGNPSVNYINGYRVYTWTNSGSVLFGTPALVSSGLVLNLDASNPASYPGTGTTWYDLSGNNNNATFGTGQSYDQTAGGSIAFAGNGVATIPHSTSLNISTGITVTAWVYYVSGNGRIIQKDDTGSNRLWELGGYGGNFRIELWNSSGSNPGAITANALTTNGWMCVTMVFDGTNIYQYQNNVLTKTTAFSGTLLTGSSAVYLGGYWGTTEWFTGKIGGAQIYNRALNTTELTTNFNATRARYGI